MNVLKLIIMIGLNYICKKQSIFFVWEKIPYKRPVVSKWTGKKKRTKIKTSFVDWVQQTLVCVQQIVAGLKKTPIILP